MWHFLKVTVIIISFLVCQIFQWTESAFKSLLKYNSASWLSFTVCLAIFHSDFSIKINLICCVRIHTWIQCTFNDTFLYQNWCSISTLLSFYYFYYYHSFYYYYFTSMRNSIIKRIINSRCFRYAVSIRNIWTVDSTCMHLCVPT